MPPQDLRACFESLPDATPKYRELELALRDGAGYGRAWHQT